MAELQEPLYLENGSAHTAAGMRLAHTSLVATEGVVDKAGGDLAVTEKSGTADMSVDVAAGAAFIDGDENNHQGTYHVYNDATVNLTIAAADATNPRKDLVVAKVQDSQYSGATDSWSLAVVTGTAAASPSEPTAPDNSITVALVDVAASASSITDANITDRRTQARMDGPIATSDLPQGELGSTEVTADVGSITTSEVVVASATVTVGTGRRVKLTASWPWVASTVANDRLELRLYEDATQKAEQFRKVDANNNAQAGGTMTTTFSAASGSVTYELRAVRLSGTGTFTVGAAASSPTILTVEDIGPA